MDINKRAERIKKELEDKKGEAVEIVDMSDSDYFVDRVVIATSLSDKHTAALLDHLKTRLKPEGEEFLKVQEGEEWIVIDLGDILVHIMTEAYRQKYKIEDFLRDLIADKNR